MSKGINLSNDIKIRIIQLFESGIRQTETESSRLILYKPNKSRNLKKLYVIKNIEKQKTYEAKKKHKKKSGRF